MQKIRGSYNMHLAFLTLLIRELKMFFFITNQTHKFFKFILL